MMINPRVYRAMVIRTALHLWSTRRIKVNTAYTPSAMMRVATEITGKQFKPRDYKAAVAALTAWLEAK